MLSEGWFCFDECAPGHKSGMESSVSCPCAHPFLDFERAVHEIVFNNRGVEFSADRLKQLEIA